MVQKARVVGGVGKTVEVDGGYFGGYISPPIMRTTAATVACAATRTASARSW
jgi:hypothetical protein